MLRPLVVLQEKFSLFKNKEGVHQHLQIPNNVTGFRKMLKEAGTKTHFVMEATGVYHLNLIFFYKKKAFDLALKMRLKSNVTFKCI